MKHTHIIFLVILIACTGCFHKKKAEKLAPELASEAMKSFDKKRYRDAIDSFNKLRDWYPFDKMAILAEFKIAEAHFNLKEYDEAILAYREFEKLHPRNEAIPYVVYRTALCYFNRLDSEDRDQTNAEKALRTFRRITKQYPDSEYVKDAEVKIVECLKSLASHEIYVGRFYFKKKHYKGALNRFLTVLDHYSGLGLDVEAEKYADLCRKKLEATKTKKQ